MVLEMALHNAESSSFTAKRKRKRKNSKRKALSNNNDTSHDCPGVASLNQDSQLERDSFVESIVNISSKSGLIEGLPNSKSSCLQNKKKTKRPKKKRRLNATKTDTKDVCFQEFASETMNAPFRTKAPVDVSINNASETAPLEVNAMCDTSTMMDSVGAPVKTGASIDASTKMDSARKLTRSRKKRMRKMKMRESLNNTVTTNIFPGKDSSLQLSVNICSNNVSVEKQPNETISLCLGKNKKKKQNDGHNVSENSNPVNFQMANGERFGKEDVNYAPKELDLTLMRGDLLLSKIQCVSPKSVNTSLIEKHDLLSKNDTVSCEGRNATAHCRKKRRKPSKSLVNSLDCIKEDGARDTLFDHSKEAHEVDLLENKLDRVLEMENAASVQVLGDIVMMEASANSSEGQPACKDSEKVMKMKNVSTQLEGHVEQKNIDKTDEIQITMQNASCRDGISGESSSDSKERTSYKTSGHDAFCKDLKQMDLKVETKMEEIFPSSQLSVIKDDGAVAGKCKEDNLPPTLQRFPERACVAHSKKKLLVLDVNGLLADIVPFPRQGYKADIIISKKAVFKRPYCDDFLRFCFERFNVGVWSSRVKKNVEKAVEFLIGDLRHSLLFCWDAYHCSETGLNTIENKNKPLVLKELRKLWDKLEPDLPWEKGDYNETNTLLLDDSPYKALRNPAYTAVFPNSYDYKDAKDSSLGPGGDLRVYLEGLALAENVQEYVRQNPFGQRAITESNPSWGFFSKIICTESSLSHDAGNTSLPNTDEVHRVSQETLSQTVLDPK